MHRTITVLFLLAACCRAAELPQVHTHGMDLSEPERLLLEEKAASGDARAAMRLWGYYALELHDAGPWGDRWLCRAAELGDATAQWNLGYSLKEGYRPPPHAFPECARQFGKTRKAAIKTLLEASARTVGSACFELASAYEKGYFGTRNRAKAREYFAKGAQLNEELCWEKLADYYRRGLGGPRDPAEAYYWISLYVRCVDSSILGPKTWKAREEIAQDLSLPVLEREWQRIDTFIAQASANKSNTDSPGTFNPQIGPEARRAFDQHEDDHRNRLRTRFSIDLAR